MKTEKQASEKQSKDAARYLDLWEENLSLIATHGLEAPKKASRD